MCSVYNLWISIEQAFKAVPQRDAHRDGLKDALGTASGTVTTRTYA